MPLFITLLAFVFADAFFGPMRAPGWFPLGGGLVCAYVSLRVQPAGRAMLAGLGTIALFLGGTAMAVRVARIVGWM
ncbi:MAG: hypothetical protein AB8G96_13125 [Phycisphaerales bacterium]